ncbi:MAG TPA: GlsB/YeaQ/YmgE family stress response membrane protein [Coriobacteriia bacterium]
MDFGFLTWILIGLVAGIIAKLVMGDRFGWIMTILLGIVGAFVGNWISGSLQGPAVTGFNLMSVLVAAGGAIVVLFIYGLVVRRG